MGQDMKTTETNKKVTYLIEMAALLCWTCSKTPRSKRGNLLQSLQRKEMLMTHWTHFIHSYMASDVW